MDRGKFRGQARTWHLPATFLTNAGVLFFGLFLKPMKVEAVEKQTYANVVIFAYFQDGNKDSYYDVTNEYGDVKIYRALKDDEFYQNTKVTADILNMYDGDSERSVKNYLNKVSDGNLEIKNIYPQYDSNTKTIKPYCITGVKLSDVLSGNRDETIIKEVMNNVILPNGTNYDYNGDGCIDNLTIIMRGGLGVASTNGYGVPTMYSHKADYGSTENWGATGKRVVAYNMLNTYSVMEDIGSSESAVLAHEFLHTVGFPDLYTIDGDIDPVYSWDLMGSTTLSPSYILAYMRMKVGKWMDADEIPEITDSQTQVTLDKQDKVGGKRACIIKSPLNNEEFFVVEFRKKASKREDIDYYIGDSGIIVYRINPAIENLTNHGKDGLGVYIFRPQSGKGFDANNSKLTVLNASLSKETGRTEMGTADMSKKLTDGAIAFSNGTNSGIVISNVSSANGDQMTFDVTIPSVKDYDTWTDTKFSDDGNSEDYTKKAVIKNWNGTPYMAVYRNSKLSLWKYEDSSWIQIGKDVSCNEVSNIQLDVQNNQLYMAYSYMDSQYRQYVKVVKMSQGSADWSTVDEIKGYDQTMKLMADGLYMTFLKQIDDRGNSNAYLAKITETAIESPQLYETGFIGQPKLANRGNTIYTSARNGSQVINVYKYESGVFTKVSSDNLKANTYDMASNGNMLYLTLGGSQAELQLYTYDGDNWETIKSGMSCYEPKLSVSQGNLYLLMTPDQNGSIKVIRYDEADKKFVEEGIDIDGCPSFIDFTAIGHKLFVAYVRQSDRKVYVKLKESTAPDTGGGETGGTGGGETGGTDPEHIHTVVNDPAVPATTARNGKTGGSHCSTCGAVITSQTVITRVGSVSVASVSAYDGGVKTPGVTVKNINGKSLVQGVDYTVSYPAGRKEIGTYTVSISLRGKYSGRLYRSFDINPKGTKLSKVKAAKKKATVTWKKQKKQTTGYQVQYSMKSDFSGAKITTIKKNATTKKVIKKLRSKKYYYVRVRTYKKVGGRYYYSDWSSAKKVKVK